MALLENGKDFIRNGVGRMIEVRCTGADDDLAAGKGGTGKTFVATSLGYNSSTVM